jgi:hypothetical protein
MAEEYQKKSIQNLLFAADFSFFCPIVKMSPIFFYVMLYFFRKIFKITNFITIILKSILNRVKINKYLIFFILNKKPFCFFPNKKGR